MSLWGIVFTRHALPTIRPVNHILDNGDVIIRTQEGTALTSHTRQAGDPGVVVAYEADAIGPDTHLGWSVVVIGYAHLVTDPADLARYQALLHPWVKQTMDYAVRIRPDLITGVLLSDADEPAAPGARGGPRRRRSAGAHGRERDEDDGVEAVADSQHRHARRTVGHVVCGRPLDPHARHQGDAAAGDAGEPQNEARGTRTIPMPSRPTTPQSARTPRRSLGSGLHRAPQQRR